MKYIFLTIFSFLILVVSADAATLRLAAPATARVGETVAVDVIATTDDIAINSIAATVQYPPEALTFTGYQEGEGVVRFWIEPPHATNGVISFAGGIPGGAIDTVGGTPTDLPLVRLLFRANEGMTAPLSFGETTLLINDGRGTALAHSVVNTRVAIAGSIAGAETDADTTPPQRFTPVLVPRDKVNGTPTLLSFTTFDRETGLQGFRIKSGFGGWKDAQSPYAVGTPLFSKRVMIAAIDLAGNETIARVIVPGVIPVALPVAVAVAVLLIGSGFTYYSVVQKRV